MRAQKFLMTFSSVLVIGAAALFIAAPASAYVACNHDGDCWQTGSKTEYSGVILSYHEDSWWDAHKSDAQYHWHDADADHRPDHGYWKKGQWYGGL